LKKSGGGSFGFRRGISPRLVDDSKKEQRETEEDCEGVFIGLGA
jgi:hypothetical protein